MERQPQQTEAIREPEQDLLTPIVRLNDAFNRGDLDAVMELFSVDAVYGGFDGREYRGKDAIREAFLPLLRGDYGRVQFHGEEVFADPASGRVMIRWLCRHEIKKGGQLPLSSRIKRLFYRLIYGRDFGWHGLDIIECSGGLVRSKYTYTRARIPLAIRKPALPTLPTELRS